MRLARQIAAAAVILGRYCKNTSPSSKLNSSRYCNINKPFKLQCSYSMQKPTAKTLIRNKCC